MKEEEGEDENSDAENGIKAEEGDEEGEEV